MSDTQSSSLKDKYKATWVSHSSISDFLTCPRLYYLRNVYKDKKTGNKITIMKPALALGQIVHEVIEALSVLPAEKRIGDDLFKTYDLAWKKISGKIGGFKNNDEEDKYKKRGRLMLQRVVDNPGPLLNKAVKIKGDLPHYWLSEKDNIILCGKVDWLLYNKDSDSVTVIDFKTGKKDGSKDSLQLPIYNLLVTNTQSRPVKGASYWYLEFDDTPTAETLPDLKDSYDKVFEVAKRIKLGRQINHLKCPTNGCFACRDLERVVGGDGERVGISEYRQDIYIID